MFERLLKLYLSKAKKKYRSKYARTLSFGDYVSDRWNKAAEIGFGKGSSVYDSSLVFDNVTVGENVWIGPFVILDGSGGGITIGDNSHISAGVQIYTHDTVDCVINNALVKKGEVKIGFNCYIGPNVVISRGVSIGDFVVIGANSFVNHNIPSYSKGFGTPFRVREKLYPSS